MHCICTHAQKHMYTAGLEQQWTCNHVPSTQMQILHYRNPDGDKKPWCFIKKDRKLRWDYCDVRKCHTPGKTYDKDTVWFII